MNSDTKNATVTDKGGNQYAVQLGSTITVDLDGFTIMSNEDYKLVDQHNALQDTMECPQSAKDSGLYNRHELAAIDHAANCSGFIAQEYIN